MSSDSAVMPAQCTAAAAVMACKVNRMLSSTPQAVNMTSKPGLCGSTLWPTACQLIIHLDAKASTRYLQRCRTHGTASLQGQVHVDWADELA